MNENVKRKLLEKNEKIVNMVIERAKRDFPDDIAVIGLTGSFSTGDFHEKSDLDLIIINNTERAWEIAHCFVLDDVGYDIYCTPWETRIKDQANLESSMVGCLVDLEVLYYATDEDLEKLKRFQEQARKELAKPIGASCIDRAEKTLNQAKQEYTNLLLADDIGRAKYAASNILFHLVDTLTNLNNTYINRGIKRYLEITSSYEYLPSDYEILFSAVAAADTCEEVQQASFQMLKGVDQLLKKMRKEFVPAAVPTAENLVGTYEELWCNYRNKILQSTSSSDVVYTFLAADGAQEYLDEMTQMFGTPVFNLMKDFHPDALDDFRESFLRVMDQYLEEYKKAGITPAIYGDFDQLYDSFM